VYTKEAVTILFLQEPIERERARENYFYGDRKRGSEFFLLTGRERERN
jgi:hypothetical protein